MTEEESKAWFQRWFLANAGGTMPVLEEIYQAFKARLKAESGGKDD